MLNPIAPTRQSQACCIRCISVASNAIQTIDNEMIHLIIHCLNSIRRDRNATYKTGLRNGYITEPSDLYEEVTVFSVLAFDVCTGFAE